MNPFSPGYKPGDVVRYLNTTNTTNNRCVVWRYVEGFIWKTQIRPTIDDRSIAFDHLRHSVPVGTITDVDLLLVVAITKFSYVVNEFEGVANGRSFDLLQVVNDKLSGAGWISSLNVRQVIVQSESLRV